MNEYITLPFPYSLFFYLLDLLYPPRSLIEEGRKVGEERERGHDEEIYILTCIKNVVILLY
jgi:hypothetical protein